MERVDTNHTAPAAPAEQELGRIAFAAPAGRSDAAPAAPARWLDERVLAAFAYNTPLVI